MSESTEVLAEIRSSLKGRTLLVGRKVGQDKFDILGATLRVEAKPQEYPTGGNVIAWKTGLLNEFTDGVFHTIILHRFLYRHVNEYIENPPGILAEAKRILPKGGILIVNSFLLDNRTKNFRSAESFFTVEDMRNMLERQSFRKVACVSVGDTFLFVCEK